MNDDLVDLMTAHVDTRTSSTVIAQDVGHRHEHSSPSVIDVDKTVSEIKAYLHKAGHESYLGQQEEGVSQLSHSLQAAEQARLWCHRRRQVQPPTSLNDTDGAVTMTPTLNDEVGAVDLDSWPRTEEDDEEVVIAALLHDIGHMIMARPDSWDHNSSTNEQHEWVGYHYLLNHGFSRRIADLVLGHVEAKRYLTCKEPQYYEKLSDASKMTLIGQGGPFTVEQARKFEESPLFDMKLGMRRWDEAAKEANWICSFEDVEQQCRLVSRHLQRNKGIQN